MSDIILTDRTRMTTLAKCPRMGFWTYYWGGTGLVPKEEALPLTFGSAVHVTFERLLVGGVDLATAIAEGKAYFSALPEPLKAEQEWLFECLIRIWAGSRLVELREEFDFLAVEKELLWILGEEGEKTVVQMIRPDLLARRLSDGELYYIEWKTTSYGDADWAKRWEKNTQVFCNALAIEETLKERVSGVMIEGLVKGPRRTEFRKSSQYQGQKIQQSFLCYGWRDATGHISPKWTSGATHEALYQIEGLTPEGWVSQLDPADYLCPVPPITPDRDDLEDWREGAKWLMLRVDEGLKAIAGAPLSERRRVVAKYFPPNYEACYPWGFGAGACPYFDLCFSPEIRKNPLGNGFVPRTPHHDAEKETT